MTDTAALSPGQYAVIVVVLLASAVLGLIARRATAEEQNVITNDHGEIGARLTHLAPHTPAELRAAAQMILDSDWTGDDWTLESIVADASVEVYRQHVEVTPGEVGCGCEGIGWFCPQGDGEPTAWLWLES